MMPTASSANTNIWTVARLTPLPDLCTSVFKRSEWPCPHTSGLCDTRAAQLYFHTDLTLARGRPFQPLPVTAQPTPTLGRKSYSSSRRRPRRRPSCWDSVRLCSTAKKSTSLSLSSLPASAPGWRRPRFEPHPHMGASLSCSPRLSARDLRHVALITFKHFTNCPPNDTRIASLRVLDVMGRHSNREASCYLHLP